MRTHVPRYNNSQPCHRDVPYSPSFILDLPAQVDQNIRNVIDFAFLPGFNNPTIAVLFQTQQTWTGYVFSFISLSYLFKVNHSRLREFKDTVRLVIFTLDIVTQNYPIITSVEGLPHECLALLPCGTSLGGVVIISSNAIIYVDQSSKRVVLPVNGWVSRISDLPLPSLTPEEQSRNICLEGSRAVFVDDRNLFVILKDGTVYPLEIVVDGKTVSKLTMSPPLAQTSIPSVLKRLDEDHFLVGSSVGPSVLLKAAHIEEEVSEDHDMEAAPATVVDDADDMDFDDDDGKSFSGL